MQLKLLNIYKLLSNISTNLVGAFIPIIVYNETGSMLFAVISLILQYVFRIGANYAFKKWYYTKPQVCLIYRIIPIALYSVFIIIMDYNVWVGIVGACVFYGISESLKRMPPEIIYNYSSLEGDSSGLGLSRLFEQLGIIAALIVGGFMLDVNKIVITLIALGIYVISVIPLLMYYFKSKNDKLFNKEYTSNAYETMKKNSDSKDKGKILAKNLLRSYGWVYFIYSFIDVLTNAFTLHLTAISSASYGTVGLFNAVYNATYGIGSYLFGLINDKKDTTILIQICCVILAVCSAVIGFVENEILLYILFGVLGLCYAPLPVFMLQQLLAKSRIMGVSNEALFVRENASNMSVVVSILFGAFGPMIPVFFSISATMIYGAGLIPYNEERTRKKLVNFLQHNEIIYERKRKRQQLRANKSQNK